jgi:hypothetical protein
MVPVVNLRGLDDCMSMMGETCELTLGPRAFAKAVEEAGALIFWEREGRFTFRGIRVTRADKEPQ